MVMPSPLSAVAPGVSAGLALFQGERFHYFLAVRREGEGVTAFVERHDADGLAVIGKVDIGRVTSVQLRVSAAEDACDFAVVDGDGGSKVLVTGADAKLITTEVAGGFVGATVGIHARIDP